MAGSRGVLTKWLPCVCLTMMAASPPAARAAVNLLHEFAGTDGSGPVDPTLSGSTLYGMTSAGGGSGMGVIFSMRTDGTGFALLREFAGGVDDGGAPVGSLVLSGSTLYGMTYGGGDSNKGVIFSMGTDGTGFAVLHEFAGGFNDGFRPRGSLLLSGSILYGMTSIGGDSNLGVIFSMGTDGTGFTLLREFAGGANDGRNPFGSLVLSGSTLYGMTNGGGDSNKGVIFSMGTDGSAFALLHEFAGGAGDGEYPYGSLVLSGSTLHGMTYGGGDWNGGVIFSLGMDGTGFTLLHEFAGGVDDGSRPYGSLVLSGSSLYGMASAGGDSNQGVILSVGTDGAGYTLLHDFARVDGGVPDGSLVPSDSVFYGMTLFGGSWGRGVAFALCPGVAITLSPETLPTAILDRSYDQAVTATGGTAPYTYEVNGGTPPPGLALGTDGRMQGTPTALGSYGFTVSATDPDGCRGSRSYVLGVNRATVDFNGDGMDDIGVFRNGTWFLSYSPDFSGVDLARPFGSSVPGMDSPDTGLFGCPGAGLDGLADLVLLRKPFSTWRASFSPGWAAASDLVYTYGTTAHKKISTRWLDTSGDGCSDIGVFRNGCFDVAESVGARVGAPLALACFGPATDEALGGDLDGDGKSDLLLWRAASAHYSYRLSSEGYAADYGADLGRGDYPLVGDLNGDGRADLGAYKAGSSTLRFTFSPDYTGLDLVVTHGVDGDIPILADVNGDGTQDIGVFRDAVAGWWFKCSPTWTTECASATVGLPGDIPIFGKPPGMP